MPESRPPALVLVADDNPVSLDVLSSVLAPQGLDIAVACNGDEVLSIVYREEPDLILLDAIMPSLDGFETCRRLKANPATQDIPIMFMTALTDARYRAQGFRAGAIDYVLKPFEPTELLARVQLHLSLRDTIRTLELRTEELHKVNERLSQELIYRERAEAARAALQAQIIAAQRDRLAELSAPLIPITDRILIMPLIGSIDDERARQVVGAAVCGASSCGAEHVILDITGVRNADETVAGMLVQATKGLELLGAQAVITGIRPEMAQALVRLAVRLDTLVTKATLQAGVQYALDISSLHSILCKH